MNVVFSYIYTEKEDFRIKAELKEKEILDLHQKVRYGVFYSFVKLYTITPKTYLLMFCV